MFSGPLTLGQSTGGELGMPTARSHPPPAAKGRCSSLKQGCTCTTHGISQGNLTVVLDSFNRVLSAVKMFLLTSLAGFCELTSKFLSGFALYEQVKNMGFRVLSKPEQRLSECPKLVCGVPTCMLSRNNPCCALAYRTPASRCNRMY